MGQSGKVLRRIRRHLASEVDSGSEVLKYPFPEDERIQELEDSVSEAPYHAEDLRNLFVVLADYRSGVIMLLSPRKGLFTLLGLDVRRNANVRV